MLSALPKILNGPSLLTWQSAMPSIIFGPFRLLGNAHLLNWLLRWPVGVDMWCRSCRPEVRIRRRVREKIRQISNLLKTFEVRTLSNSNVNFVTSLLTCCQNSQNQTVEDLTCKRFSYSSTTVKDWNSLVFALYLKSITYLASWCFLSRYTWRQRTIDTICYKCPQDTSLSIPSTKQPDLHACHCRINTWMQHECNSFTSNKFITMKKMNTHDIRKILSFYFLAVVIINVCIFQIKPTFK